ncbi:hypothetical protein PM082_006093 [Marasmius tenuissimus]|nr:hypothetical protein PM082_006093 [Marasmius tenuissimus]
MPSTAGSLPCSIPIPHSKEITLYVAKIDFHGSLKFQPVEESRDLWFSNHLTRARPSLRSSVRDVRQFFPGVP